MTLPFAGYILMLFTNFPVNTATAVMDFFTPLCVLEKIVAIIGLGLLAYSIIYMKQKKHRGLIISARAYKKGGTVYQCLDAGSRPATNFFPMRSRALTEIS